MRRVLSVTLYFLELDLDGRMLHKIGVTSRSVEERAAEVADELRAWQSGLGATPPSVRVVSTWPHRGNVELYFKHRYADERYRIGTLTEYFIFADSAAVLRDLRRMSKKVLSEVEQAILDGEPSRSS